MDTLPIVPESVFTRTANKQNKWMNKLIHFSHSSFYSSSCPPPPNILFILYLYPIICYSFVFPFCVIYTSPFYSAFSSSSLSIYFSFLLRSLCCRCPVCRSSLLLRSVAVGDFSHFPSAVLSLCARRISGTMYPPLWCTETLWEGFVCTKCCSDMLVWLLPSSIIYLIVFYRPQYDE
jgi:hypothetical protein